MDLRLEHLSAKGHVDFRRGICVKDAVMYSCALLALLLVCHFKWSIFSWLDHLPEHVTVPKITHGQRTNNVLRKTSSLLSSRLYAVDVCRQKQTLPSFAVCETIPIHLTNLLKSFMSVLVSLAQTCRTRNVKE